MTAAEIIESYARLVAALGDPSPEEEAKTKDAGLDLKKKYEDGIARDEQRIEQLEKENEERATGKEVKPTPPPSDLDKPIKAKPPHDKTPMEEP